MSLITSTSACVSFVLVVLLKAIETVERINMEKLKAREQIMFFDEVLLFEDELHDHGVSMISVKIVSAAYISQLILQIRTRTRITKI